MESSLESISIIKEENNIQKRENYSNKLNIMNKEDELNFSKGLDLSKIEFKEEQIKQNNKNEDDNLNDLSDYSFIKENNKKNKITKENLNNIPIPIFSCIYCCNEKISFNHLSNEIISNKYLLQTSIYDIRQLNNIISSKKTQKTIENKLLNLILNNFENLNTYYNRDKISIFFMSKKFWIKCEKNKYLINKKFKMKLEEQLSKKKKDFYFKEIKGMYKISKNSVNNKCLFNSNSLMNNYSSLAGLIPTGPELIQNLAEKKNNSLNSSHISNLIIQGNSKYLKKNEIGLIVKDNNKHYVENIIEKFDKNVESDIFEFLGENDIKRKINRKDIEWEESYYDINKPIIEEVNDNEESVLNFTNNKNNKNRNSINIKLENKKIINSKHLSINSENKSHLKISIFNNSKSLTSTNTSSNIIQKNKESRSLSIFLNKNKINDINNNSLMSPRNDNIILKNIIKARKEIKESNLTPSFSKKKLGEFDSKSFKKLIQKKILFNHTVNINKESIEYKNICYNHIDLDKLNQKKLFLYSLNKNNIINNKENIINKSYNRFNNIKNNYIGNNITFLDKMIKRFKSNKDNNKKHSNFNSVFKFNNNIKAPINNIKYSLIKSLNKEKIIGLYLEKNDYINNLVTTNINKKENNLIKYISEKTYNGNKNQKQKINSWKNKIKIIS